MQGEEPYWSDCTQPTLDNVDDIAWEMLLKPTACNCIYRQVRICVASAQPLTDAVSTTPAAKKPGPLQPTFNIFQLCLHKNDLV